jgi:hypothetical protein
LDVHRDPPLVEQLDERLNATTQGRLLEIIGDDQNAAHEVGLSRR